MTMQRRIACVLLLLLACACVCAAVPERPRFRIIGTNQGLPSTEIKALVRDHDGYLWIGTADGLARHDGVDMRVWRHDPDSPNGLPGNNVQALLVDARDRIWVAVEGEGVSVLDASRQHFIRYRKASHPALESDDVWAMAQQGSAVWLGTFGGGLTRIDADGGQRHFNKQRSGLPADTVLALAVDAQGVLWVGTTKGLARLQGETFETVELPDAEGPQMIYSLATQSDGVWVGGAQGIWRRTSGQWTQPAWSPMFQRPNALLAIVTDTRGDHWMGSQRGLWHQDGANPPVPVPMGGPDIARAIGSLLLEHGQALWAPVQGRGLGYLRADWRQQVQFQGAEDGLHGAMYRALGKAGDGGIWLGGMGGMIEHMDAQGRIAMLDPASLDQLHNIKPVVIAEDRQRRLWIGHRGGLVRISRNGGVEQWASDAASDPVPSGQIGWLLHPADGSQWLAAPGGGVQQRDPDSGKLLRDFPAGAASGLGEADIESMVLAADGSPWIACSTGILQFDAGSGRFQPVAAMGRERVYALAFDGADTLWLQRLSGLEQYQRHGAVWQQRARIDTRHGMPAVAAAALLVDAQHRPWITTSRGLYRWDSQRRNLRHVGMQDAANSEEFLERAALLRDDGVLVAATADGGLRLVDTTLNDAAPVRPVLRFGGMDVRRDGGWQALPMQQALTLAAQDREVRIRARLLMFDDPAGNRYWSRLDGFDRTWVALGNSGERVFTGLAPGRYVVRMRAQDAAGNAAPEQVLHFDVPPPWWRSTWAQALYVLAVLGLIGLLAWWYRARLQRRHAWELAEHKRALAEQASEAKSRFLATLGHEVRTPMTGVLGMSELLQGSALDARQRGQVDAIRRAGEHLLRLVNDALDLARIEAGKLQLTNTDFLLRPLLDEVAGLMAPVAERKGLVFVDGIAPSAPLAVHGDRTRVQQILLNLIGNAVKFTETGHVALETFALHPHGVRFVVADTGPGLNAEQKTRLFRRFEQAEGARTTSRYGGSGLGLAISQELAAAMGGRIQVDSEPGTGTRFIVELPLADAALESNTTPPLQRVRPASALSLLLVEDDPIVAEVMQGLLRAQGHQVVHAAHGLAALGETSQHSFDAALLDLDLPGMDGLSLATLLRARGFNAPLLAVTARSDTDAEAHARAAGFDGFLRKPVTGELLAQALESLLRPH
jgi:ligand-binding sensor domain-containing protein/nitrogen-specific signal transduction histidine kinase